MILITINNHYIIIVTISILLYLLSFFNFYYFYCCRHIFCKSVATLKWHLQFHFNCAQSLFYLLTKIKRKLATMKSSDRNVNTTLSPLQLNIPLKQWSNTISVRRDCYSTTFLSFLFYFLFYFSYLE